MKEFMNRKNKIYVILTIFVTILFLSSCGVGPAVKELKKINNSDARYWIDFIKKNGINAIDDDGDVLLLSAAKADNTALVKACIKSGAEVNMYVTKGYIKQGPALSIAIKNGNTEMIEALLKAKAVIRSDDDNIDNLALLFRDKKTQQPEVLEAVLSKAKKYDLNYYASEDGLLDKFYDVIDDNLFFENINKFLKKGYKPSEGDYNIILEKLAEIQPENYKQIYNDLHYAVLDYDYVNTIPYVVSEDYTVTYKFLSEEIRMFILKQYLPQMFDTENETNFSIIMSCFRTFSGENRAEWYHLMKEVKGLYPEKISFSQDDVERFIDAELCDSTLTLEKRFELIKEVLADGYQYNERWFNSYLDDTYRNRKEEFEETCKYYKEVNFDLAKSPLLDHLVRDIGAEHFFGFYEYWKETFLNGSNKEIKEILARTVKEVEYLKSLGFELDYYGRIYEEEIKPNA